MTLFVDLNSCTEFTQLKNQCGLLIGLPSDGFVLQYVDDESDLINLSSNEDFAIAVEISGGLVRLIATSGSTPALDNTVGTQNRRRYCRKQYQGYGKGGKSDRLPREEKHKQKLELLKKFLSEMPPDNALTPQQEKRKNHLRLKIQKAESRLSNWQEREKSRHSDKRKRWEKKEQDKKISRQFSPEVEQQIKDLKAQVNLLKPAARELRIQKKQKKTELENCLQTGSGDKEVILQEIVEIKEKIGQLNAQMKPARDNIRALKGKQ